MSIFLDKEIKHQAFVCGKIHVLKTKPGCCGTSCMRDSVPVCLLPCAVLLICLFNRVHTNLLLGPFALCVDMQRNGASRTSAGFDLLVFFDLLKKPLVLSCS